MLSVTALNQYYGGSHILRDVSFELPDGQSDRAARSQRRRQDDAAAHAHGTRAASKAAK